MNLARTFWVALRALARTKTRSFLTVLGVIIGVGAVIAMVSIGEGAKARVAEAFESMGRNTLVLRSGSVSSSGARGGAGSRLSVTWDDVSALAELPSIDKVAPQLRTNAQVLSQTQNWMTQVTGTSPNYFAIRNWPAEIGELFSDEDVTSKRKVVVLGKTVAENLFGVGSDPVGEIVRINGNPFQVIGVAAAKGTSAWGSDNDDSVFIPASTFTAKVAGGLQKYVDGSVVIAVRPELSTAVAQDEIGVLLRRRHRLRPGSEDDFIVRDLSEVAQAQEESAATITSLLAGVALVSLLVGGIGIMNIMLVSVTERTREIGLRMAIGAKPRHILTQFLIEAVLLSVLGGLTGIAAGIGAAKYMAMRFGFPLLLRMDIVLLAVGVSGLVGIIFGLYPAQKASRLDPIQSLRYE
jgi:putative ABC transport system permease protein